MIQDVKALPVSFYFSPDGTTSFFIPKYQREYVWGGKCLPIQTQEPWQKHL